MNARTEPQPWIAVAGASGFIGRALCQGLADRGYGVLALGRDPGQLIHSLKGLRSANCKIASYQQLSQHRPAALINLAGANIGAKRWSTSRKQELRDSRLNTTAILMEAAGSHWQNSLQTVINASAIGFYGDGGDAPLDEEAEAGDDFAARLCRDWEQSVTPPANCRRVIARLGVVLGPVGAGGALDKMKLPFSLGLGARFGSGEHWQAYIHREDAVAALLFALENNRLSGPINVVCPQPLRNRDFTRTLATVLHRPALLSIPAPAASLLFGEMKSLLYSSQRVLPRRLLDAGFSFRYPGVAEALQASLFPQAH